MTECKWTRKICDQLRECGCLVFVAAGNKYGTVGWPDRHIILRTGEMFWLEFKSFAHAVTPLQKNVIAEINKRRPGTAFVVRQGGVSSTVDNIPFDGTGKGLLKCLKLIQSTITKTS